MNILTILCKAILRLRLLLSSVAGLTGNVELILSIVLRPCFVGDSGQIESCYVSQLALAAYLAEADPPKRETLHILATPSLLNHPLPVQLSTKERGKALLGVPHIF